MTPDAVVYRYFELIESGQSDPHLLLALIYSDADLLARWLHILQIPARASLLAEGLARLGPDEFKALADAQVWTVAPTADSARLSLEQWLAVVRARQLAAILYNHLSPESEEAAEDVGLRSLLALSGVHLPLDAELSGLSAFRGTRTELLEDASLELKVFTIVDAIELGRDERLALELLSLESGEYQNLFARAEARTSDVVERLNISADPDVDWAHRIWLRQQVKVAANAFAQCNDLDDLAQMHVQVARTLFTRPPILLRQTPALTEFVLFPDQDLVVNRSSRSSIVAATGRTGSISVIEDSQDTPVIDRQLLHRLDADRALVAATTVEPVFIFIAAAEDDLDVQAALQLYVDAFALHVPQPDFQRSDDGVSAFREAEVARLKEIVHEANNPLSIVHNYLHILELRLQDDPTTAEQIRLIASELQRAGDIFARAREIPEALSLSPVQLRQVVDFEVVGWLAELAELHSGLMHSGKLHFEFHHDVDTLSLHVDQGALHQVLANLLKNAAEATPPGGRISLTMRHQYYRSGRAGVEITVADTGPGLSDEILANLKGAKDTTKGDDHQGIGLQVVYRLGNEMGAELDLSTGPNGTEFQLFIPG